MLVHMRLIVQSRWHGHSTLVPVGTFVLVAINQILIATIGLVLFCFEGLKFRRF
jgi:cytochrome b